MYDFDHWRNYKCAWAAVRLAAALVANNGIVNRHSFVAMLQRENIKNAKDSTVRAIQDLEREDLVVRSPKQVRSKDMVGLAEFIAQLINEDSQMYVELHWKELERDA